MQHKATITLQALGKKIKVNKGTPLIDVLHEFGVEFPCGGKGTCGRCKVQLLNGKLKVDAVQQQKLEKLGLAAHWRLACFCKVESDISLEVSQFENIILADSSQFEFTPLHGFGIVFDLGTTTVVAQLLNLANGNLLDSVSVLNPQAKYGSDLISRIQSCLDGNYNNLQKLIHKKTGQMIRLMLKNNPVEISKIVLVGNTVMHHIFSGLPVTSLSSYPFESSDPGIQNLSPTQVRWDLPSKTPIQFYPSVGSFVGSDILAGIAATKMSERTSYTALIDLGTNGEIVVGNRDKILCASTAAGPAFEGARISQGMRATTGAISSVDFENETMKSHVIGNVAAKGICGSGLIDVMAILLQRGKIGLFGEINSGEIKIKITDEVYITQQDIREFQLAKAAIATGVQILVNQLSITAGEIDQVFIAGGFGSFLNIDNVIRTGLLECEADKVVKLGNTALIGAKMFLFENEKPAQDILRRTSHINLESDAGFQDIYINKLLLACD